MHAGPAGGFLDPQGCKSMYQTSTGRDHDVGFEVSVLTFQIRFQFVFPSIRVTSFDAKDLLVVF